MGNRISIALLLTATLATTGCSRFGIDEGRVTLIGSPASIITLDTIQSIEKFNWRVDGAGKAYVASHSVRLSGHCAKSAASIRVYSSGGILGTVAPCAKDGVYIWTGTLADNEYILSFAGVAANGNSIPGSGSLHQTLIVDTTPPPPPVILTNNGLALHSLNPRIELTGTNTSDAYAIDTSGAGTGTLHTSNGVENFTFDVSLTAGETLALSLTAVDFVGNRSSATTMDLSHLANVQIADRAFLSHSRVASVAAMGGWTMEASAIGPMMLPFIAGSGNRDLSAGSPAVWMLQTP